MGLPDAMGSVIFKYSFLRKRDALRALHSHLHLRCFLLVFKDRRKRSFRGRWPLFVPGAEIKRFSLREGGPTAQKSLNFKPHIWKGFFRISKPNGGYMKIQKPKKDRSSPDWFQTDSSGGVKHPIRTFIRLMFSDDNHLPSSTRIVGTWIFTFVTLAVGFLTAVLGWKLHETLDPKIVESLMVGIKTLLWIYTTMLASALSMYGINAWKYITQIQAGVLAPAVGMLNSQMGQYSTMSQTTSMPSYQGGTSLPVPPVKKAPVINPDPPEPPKPVTKNQIAGVGNDD